MSILGLVRDAGVSALGHPAAVARSMLIPRCGLQSRRRMLQSAQVFSWPFDFPLAASLEGNRSLPQRGDESESGLFDGTHEATHRQQSRRRVMNCVTAMARFGRHAAVQRESENDCGGDCGETAYDARSDTRRESLPIPPVCNQGSLFRSRLNFFKAIPN
jgi:hypothetical protein